MSQNNNDKKPKFNLEAIKKDFDGDFEKILTMENNDNVSALVSKIEEFVKNRFFDGAKEYISTHQLRNIYDKVLKCNENNIQLIRPKLAYVAARQQKAEAKELVKFFNELIKDIENSPSKLESFKIFFEAIVAYHKFYSPKK
ncbi:MAG: type III-A CRISPR-associated protein Csm2 [Cyclobacteriaceae bacterium]